MTFYVVKPLDVDVEPKNVCEVYRIEAVSASEAVAKMKAGQGEKHTMHRRFCETWAYEPIR